MPNDFNKNNKILAICQEELKKFKEMSGTSSRKDPRPSPLLLVKHDFGAINEYPLMVVAIEDANGTPKITFHYHWNLKIEPFTEIKLTPNEIFKIGVDLLA